MKVIVVVDKSCFFPTIFENFESFDKYKNTMGLGHIEISLESLAYKYFENDKVKIYLKNIWGL